MGRNRKNSGAQQGHFDWRNVLVKAAEPPQVIAISPAQGSDVQPRRISAQSDVYLSISVDAFSHPVARKGLTRQVPLIFAEAKFRRETDRDLPSTAVLGPLPGAGGKARSHQYAFGGRTFFGPVRLDGSVELAIGLHLHRSSQAGRRMLEVARHGSRLMTAGGDLLLLKPGVDAAFDLLKGLLPEGETPWIAGILRDLLARGGSEFETGTWAVMPAGTQAGEVFFDRQNSRLCRADLTPLAAPYFVYSIDAADTISDRLRIGDVAAARERLRKAISNGEATSEAQLTELFELFRRTVILSEELTQRDKDEIIAAEAGLLNQLLSGRKAGAPAPVLPDRVISVIGLSEARRERGPKAAADAAEAAIMETLAALKNPSPDQPFEAMVTELGTAVRDFAIIVRSDPDNLLGRAIHIAKQLRRQREFRALLTLAEEIARGGVDIGWLSYFAASAIIDLGGVEPYDPEAEDAAEDSREAGEAAPTSGFAASAEAYLGRAMELCKPEHENDTKLLSECLGLAGRIWKTRAVMPGTDPLAAAQAFERSFAFYGQGAALPVDPDFHRVNQLGLIRAAEKIGLRLARPAEAKRWARAILARAETALKAGSDNPYIFSNGGDAALFLGREDKAAELYRKFVESQKDNAFALNASRRQLAEVWGQDVRGNTDISAVMRDMVEYSAYRASSLSMSLEEIEVMDLKSDAEAQGLEALFDGPPALPRAHVRDVLRLSQGVGLVRRPNGRPVGTGFLLRGHKLHPQLGEDLVFVTNDHVVSDQRRYPGVVTLKARDARIVFEDLDPEREFSVREVLWASPASVHDIAILRLTDQPSGLEQEFEIADSLPGRWLTEEHQAARDAPKLAPRVFVMGHPNGRGLEITFERNYLIDHELANPSMKATPAAVRVHYRAPTESGSSGSPVLSAASRKLIAVHHGWAPKPLFRELKDNEVYEANEGLWIQAVRAAFQAETGTGAARVTGAAAEPVS